MEHAHCLLDTVGYERKLLRPASGIQGNILASTGITFSINKMPVKQDVFF
jgi:hypothetical protein